MNLEPIAARMRLWSLRIFCVILLGVSVARAAGGEGAVIESLAARGFRYVPLRTWKGENALTFDALVNRVPVQLAIETASLDITIDRATAQRLSMITLQKGGEPHVVGALGASESERLAFARRNTLEINNIVMPKSDFQLIDIRDFVSHFDGNVVGAFGLLSLRQLAAVIDCGGKRLYLNPAGYKRQTSVELAAALKRRGFTPIRFSNPGFPSVSCLANGCKTNMIINTDSPSSLSSVSASRAHVTAAETREVYQAAGGRRARASRGRIADLQMNAFHLKDIPVLVFEAKSNFLGLDQLRKHSAIIDIGDGALYLR